jgi:hypothetical protein
MLRGWNRLLWQPVHSDSLVTERPAGPAFAGAGFFQIRALCEDRFLRDEV